MSDDILAGNAVESNSPARSGLQPNVFELQEHGQINEATRGKLKKLYDGCKVFTRLSFLVRLLHFQSISYLANVHFDKLLDLLQKVIPNDAELKKLFGSIFLVYYSIIVLMVGT